MKKTTIIMIMLMGSYSAFSQSKNEKFDWGQEQNNRPNDQTGINIFEAKKSKASDYTGPSVRIGGAFALQYQAFKNKNVDTTAGTNELLKLEKNTNLPTANLYLHSQLAMGVRLMLTTYLSSRHHPEPYVKDGYLQVDSLDFIKKGFLSGLMQDLTLRVGHMETNYGDAHLRRSDNGNALYNPFVGNLILDSFTTEVGGQVLYRKSGFLVMVGLTNGKLNQDVISPDKTEPAFIGKIGYDNQLNSDLRVRVTGSAYTLGKAKSIYLYSGDRAGARYYCVMQTVTEGCSKSNFRTGRWNPSFKGNVQSFMVNTFVKWTGLEFFATIEQTEGGDSTASTVEKRKWTQLAAELLYRFGENEKFYLGARYNVAKGKLVNTDAKEVSIDRIQAVAGWFLTKNIVMKLEYVQQNYKDFDSASKYNEGQFNGIIVESSILF